MENAALAIYLVGGIISLGLTLQYLPSGILFIFSLPLFPLFGLYAGAEHGDWNPSLWFFGSIIVATIIKSVGDKKEDNEET